MMKFTVFACLTLAILCLQTCDARLKVRSLARQCTDQGFNGVCSISAKNPTKKNRCSQTLQCAVVSGSDTFKQPGGKIPDGTPCGEKKMCVSRKCVEVQETAEVVGSNSAVTCRKIVPRDKKIEPRPLQPLSP